MPRYFGSLISCCQRSGAFLSQEMWDCVCSPGLGRREWSRDTPSPWRLGSSGVLFIGVARHRVLMWSSAWYLELLICHNGRRRLLKSELCRTRSEHHPVWRRPFGRSFVRLTSVDSCALCVCLCVYIHARVYVYAGMYVMCVCVYMYSPVYVYVCVYVM